MRRVQPAHGDGYLPTLDGWRAVAIAFVLLDHAGDAFRWLLPGMADDAFRALKERCGLFGVHVFFSLSGYLITSRLIREAGRGQPNLREFYLRRLFRIQPPALVYLATVGALALLGVLPVTLASWRAATLCYANFLPTGSSWYTGHFWSLAIEEHFYLAWPLLFILFGKRRMIGALALVAALSVWRAVAIKFQILMSTPWWIVRTDMQAEYLAWGCAFALVQADGRWRATLNRFTGRAATAGLIAIGAAAGFATLPGWKAQHLLSTAGAGAMALVLVATSANPGTLLGRVLEARLARWIGRISYSLYLWQQLVCAWDDKRAPALGVAQRFPVNIALALAAAILSYRLVEQPALAIGKRVIRRIRRGRVVDASADVKTAA